MTGRTGGEIKVRLERLGMRVCGHKRQHARVRVDAAQRARTDWFKLQSSKSVELGVTSKFEVAVGTFRTICEFDSGGSATLWNSQLFFKSYFLGVKIEFV